MSELKKIITDPDPLERFNRLRAYYGKARGAHYTPQRMVPNTLGNDVKQLTAMFDIIVHKQIRKRAESQPASRSYLQIWDGVANDARRSPVTTGVYPHNAQWWNGLSRLSILLASLPPTKKLWERILQDIAGLFAFLDMPDILPDLKGLERKAKGAALIIAGLLALWYLASRKR